MRMLELFSGLEGGSSAAKRRGWGTVTLDNDPRFGADFVRDILTVRDLRELEGKGGAFDFIWASPPCTCFTTMTMRRNWTQRTKGPMMGKAGPPAKTPSAKLALAIVKHTYELLVEYRPKRGWVIENPKAALRSVWRPPTDWTTYCQWGIERMKPTDLWIGEPLRVRWGGLPKCHSGGEDHIRAPRGSYTGTQGMDPALSAKVPYALSKAFIVAAETDGVVRAAS